MCFLAFRNTHVSERMNFKFFFLLCIILDAVFSSLCRTKNSPTFQKCIVPGTTFTPVKEMMHEINMLFSEKYIPVELGVQGITSSAQEQNSV